MATQTTNLLTFRPAKRIQQSVSAAYEKRLLIWMAERTPAWINSDHLTSLGFAAQLLTGAAYAMSGFSRAWLVAAIAFLALNWLGDSLDGTLARVRQHQRPRYGFYVDHILDSIGSVALMGGLALSGYMSPLIAVGLLVLFLLLSIQSYLATYTLGEFRMSFWSFGPTELRLLLVAGNLALFRVQTVFHGHFKLFDFGGAIGIIAMTAMLLFHVAWNVVRLYNDGVLTLLKSGLGLNYLLATGLAVEAAVLHNFIWHERFTWADRRAHTSLSRLAKFNLTTGGLSILGNMIAMKLLVEMAGVEYLLANLLSIATCSILNFFVADRTIFVPEIPKP